VSDGDPVTPSSYPHPIIAREGWPFLGVSALAACVATWWVGWWSVPFWIAAMFVLQFFRDPPRQVPEEMDSVLAPADGRVVAVESARDPYLERDATKVSIFMNVFNVHSNRSPVDGLIKKRWHNRGKFLNAALDKASLENERNALWLRTRGGGGRNLRASGRTRCEANNLLRWRGRPTHPRSTLRFHSVRVAGRRLHSNGCNP